MKILRHGIGFWFALFGLCLAPAARAQQPAMHQTDHFGRHFDDAAEWAKSFDDPARDVWQKPAETIASAVTSAPASKP